MTERLYIFSSSQSHLVLQARQTLPSLVPRRSICPSVIIPPVGDLAAPETPAPISCFPITMKASLAVFILAALLATGACLQCEVCEGPGTSCTGDLQTCAAGIDSCGITLTEVTLVGMKQQVIAKGCVTSGSCKGDPLTMNFGNGLTMKVGIACCMGDACRTTTVTVPPADTKPNGRSCPACVGMLSAKCNEEIIDCTGAETRCVELAGTTTMGGTVTPVTMKGCATEAFCANETEGSGSFAGVSTDLTLKCKAPGTAWGPAGLLIPALAGLLLTQLLS
nr:phospholipase A2 inhibitor gamma subunit B-like [Caretta caretta]